jgi:flagellar biosynthetic protein FliP
VNRTRWILLALGLILPAVAFAEQGIPAFISTPGTAGAVNYSLSLETLILLTAMTFIPAALLMMTSFTRIVIVLALLRQALGTLQSPPNQVIVGLSLFLTLFVMSPVIDKIYAQAYQPFAEDKLNIMEALNKGSEPLKEFMLHQTRKSDLALFVKIAKIPPIQDQDAVPLKVLVPAFIISELKTAFQIGFIIFLPFLIIDLVVASVLMAMGMMMLSPVTISFPFKLMLFVLVDGWGLIIGSLVQSFYV